jgi:hypothetical protein|tara:strand:- start:2781 stop:3035 length:255 start_codon:yes stop_codon:yes gene_type:complete
MGRRCFQPGQGSLKVSTSVSNRSVGVCLITSVVAIAANQQFCDLRIKTLVDVCNQWLSLPRYKTFVLTIHSPPGATSEYQASNV